MWTGKHAWTTGQFHAVKGSEHVGHHTCSTRGCGAATRIVRRGAAPMLAVACRAQGRRSQHGLTLLHCPAQRCLRTGLVAKYERRSDPDQWAAAHSACCRAARTGRPAGPVGPYSSPFSGFWSLAGSTSLACGFLRHTAKLRRLANASLHSTQNHLNLQPSTHRTQCP